VRDQLFAVQANPSLGYVRRRTRARQAPRQSDRARHRASHPHAAQGEQVVQARASWHEPCGLLWRYPPHTETFVRRRRHRSSGN